MTYCLIPVVWAFQPNTIKRKDGKNEKTEKCNYLHRGGGPLLTGTIGESKAYNCDSEQRERAETQSENHAFRGAVFRESSKTVSESVPQYEQVSNIGQTLKRVQGDNISSLRADECRRGNPVKNTASPCCHAELRERAEALSGNVKHNCHAELVSASVQRCVLPVSMARFRNKFGMTPPVKAASCLGWSLKSHVQPLWMVLSAWIATRSATARNDRGWLEHATFTMAARLSRSTESRAIKGLRAHGRRIAFTMAEILLSLTIIGVVAAITLPSLTGNINERTWNTQRKALYARFSQAIALMPALNGYGTLTEDSSSGASDAVDTAAETFITSGLSKVLKINNICDNEHLEDCGLVSAITPLGGGSAISLPLTMGELNSNMVGAISMATESISIMDAKAAAFETQNGESIIVYYNPNCVGDLQNLTWNATTGYWGQNRVCANFIYDLNGNKGPNSVGKDIGFMTLMYPSDPKISAPYPYVRSSNTTYTNSSDAIKECTANDSEYRIPNMEEMYSLFVNKNLIGLSSGVFWTSTLVSNNTAVRFLAVYANGQVDDFARNTSSNLKVWCVKR